MCYQQGAMFIPRPMLVLLTSRLLLFVHNLRMLNGTRRNALLENYVQCGVHKLDLCPTKLTSTTLVKWRSIGNQVVGIPKYGGLNKVPKVLYHDTYARDLVKYMKGPHLAYLFRSCPFSCSCFVVCCHDLLKIEPSS